MTRSVSEILDDWKARDISWVRFELPDLHGTARVKLVPLNAAQHFAEEGLNMYGGAQVLDSRSDVVPDSGYNNEYQYADQLLRPDLSTAQMVPWQPGHARFICSAYSVDGTPRVASPRQLLQKVLATAGAMGYSIRTGMEYENYFLQRDGTPLFGGYHIFNPVRNTYHPVVLDLLEALPKMGIDLITANAEYGPGQFELNFGPGDGLEGPDKSYTYKNAVKEIAHKHDLIGTFMSKPISGLAGCGAHFHLSLIDRDGRSVIGADGDEWGLSRRREAVHRRQPQVREGRVHAARPDRELLQAPPAAHVRAVEHLLGPRGPVGADPDQGRHGGARGTSSTARRPGCRTRTWSRRACWRPGCSASARASSWSRRRDRVPAEDDPKYEQLPWSPREALDRFERCEPLRAILGDEFCDIWSTVRRYELQRFDDHVTDWERTEYLEIY